MSQQPMEQMDMYRQPQGTPQAEMDIESQPTPNHEDEFALGMDTALDGGQSSQEAGEEAQAGQEAGEEQVSPPVPDAPLAPLQDAPPPDTPEPQPYASQDPDQEQPPAPDRPQAPAKVEMPEHLQGEFEHLLGLDPELAQLALEDSADGKTIRARLEEYGAAIAHDYARLVVLSRQQRLDMERVRQEQVIRDAQAQQAHFMGVMQQEHPDFYGLITGKDQAAQARFRNEMLAWIQGKPYADAAPLMQIFQYSRDPRQVAGLLTQFKRERAAAKRPDPTGALAVPGRGGTVAPAGIGDMDDFDAGLDAGLSSD